MEHVISTYQPMDAEINETNIKMRFMIKLYLVMGLTALILFAGITCIKKKYVIGISSQEVKCLPYVVYLVIKDEFNPNSDQYVSFKADYGNLEPYYPDGTLLFKKVIGRPGDLLEVIDNKYFINKKLVGEARTADKNGNRFKRLIFNGRIPDDSLFVMGTEPRSYDSRYYGLIKLNQVIGRGVPII